VNSTGRSRSGRGAAAETSVAVAHFGRVSVSTEVGAKELRWRTSADEGGVRTVARGERRGVLDMPRHRVGKVLAFFAGVSAVAASVLGGLLALAEGEGAMPPVARVVAYGSVLLFMGAVSVLMLKDRERLEIDSRVIIAEQGPLEIVVCRSEVKALSVAPPESSGPGWARLAGVAAQVVALPPDDANAEPLPLTGHGLTSAEAVWAVDALNDLMREVPADALFDCRRLTTAPGYVARLASDTSGTLPAP